MPERVHTLACIGGALVDRVVTQERATLTLGASTVGGNQPVSGGSANVVIMATSRQFGEL